jgi:hypothetical protein
VFSATATFTAASDVNAATAATCLRRVATSTAATAAAALARAPSRQLFSHLYYTVLSPPSQKPVPCYNGFTKRTNFAEHESFLGPILLMIKSFIITNCCHYKFATVGFLLLFDIFRSSRRTIFILLLYLHVLQDLLSKKY